MRRGSYVMRNGSGLNDTNRMSAAQHCMLLKTMWDRFPLAPEFMSSLGIAGKDGTIKYRFEGTDAVWRLRAKTGTLENVSALSGYVQPATSAKVMVFDDSSIIRARLLPKEKAPPLPPPCIWRMKKIQTPISSSMGNQETKMLVRKDCSSSGLATTLTLFLSRSETIHRSGGA